MTGVMGFDAIFWTKAGPMVHDFCVGQGGEHGNGGFHEQVAGSRGGGFICAGIGLGGGADEQLIIPRHEVRRSGFEDGVNVDTDRKAKA